MKKNSKHLMITGVIGLIYGVFSSLIYYFFIEKVWRPIFIAIFVLVFGIIVTIMSIVLNMKRGDGYNSDSSRAMQKLEKSRRAGIIIMAILVVVSFSFEILYEIGGRSVPSNPSSYVFLIDCSGSMEENDPNMRRSEAISQIMQNQADNLPYTIYAFEDDAKKIKDFSLYRSTDEYAFYNGGGTNILRSVRMVVDDVKDNPNAGKQPRIIVLSDGYSRSSGLNSVVRKCVKNRITVSCVGLSTENSLLQAIADGTGGVYRYADNVSDLIAAMESASQSIGEIGRDLLSARFVFKLDVLYGFLRVAFLLIMGVIWSFAKSKLHGSPKSSENDQVLFLGAILTMVAAIQMEVLHLLAVPSWLIQIILCVLWALTPGVFKKAETQKSGLGGLDINTQHVVKKYDEGDKLSGGAFSSRTDTKQTHSNFPPSDPRKGAF